MRGGINRSPGRNCSSRFRRERDQQEAARAPPQAPSGSGATAAHQHENIGSRSASAALARGLEILADQTRPSGQTAAVAHRPGPHRDRHRQRVEVSLVQRALRNRLKMRDRARRVPWEWESGPLSVNVPVAEIPNLLCRDESQGKPVLPEAEVQEGKVASHQLPQAHSSYTAATGNEKETSSSRLLEARRILAVVLGKETVEAREKAPIGPSLGSKSGGDRLGGAGKDMNTLRDCALMTVGTTSSGRSTLQTPTPLNAAAPTAGGGNGSSDSTTASPGYTLPPHPYTFGTHFQANVCPACEQYKITEKDRPSDTDPMTETLRARFRCHLCGHFLDIGMVLFDPRGTPGVTLYEGQDRFVPPVPPAAKYPCPRCWMAADVKFERMVVYLKEESRVACLPKCDERRLRVKAGGSSSASKKGKGKWGS